MTRSITPAGRSLIEQSESCRLKSYQDTGGVWTIGYGRTKDVYQNQVITQDQAVEMLDEDLILTENGVSTLLLREVNDNQFSALVCFAYNEGLGTLEHSSMLAMIDKGQFIEASAQFPLYNKAKVNGKLTVLPGLVIRRHNEQALFLAPVALSAPVIVPTPAEHQTSVPAAPVRVSLWQRFLAWL